MKYCGNKTMAVQFVREWLPPSLSGSQWTMTITPDGSGGYFVSTATSISSADTEKADYYDKPPSI